MELIDKDALLAEINRQHKILMQTDHTYGAQFVLGFRQACRQIIDFLDTLEVKEVDLEKVIEEYFKGWTDDYDNGGAACHYQYVQVQDCKAIAKHFFELGLKAARNNN